METRRIISLSLVMLIFSAGSLIAQPSETAVDSTFRTYMSSAWDEIDKSGFSDTLQNKYASEFFGYYLNHPETKTGIRAGREAFMMWGNTGAADEVDEAMAQIGFDSKMWSQILIYIGNAYYKSEREDYNDLLMQLKENVTHPESKSAVLLRLAGIFHGKEETKKVKKLASEVIALDAHEFHVDRAKGLLYEIENLSIGKKAPDFAAETIKGETISLSNLKGKVVLLDFWATWCGPCLPEIPHHEAIYAEHSQEDLQIVSISLDRSLEDLTEFLNEKKMDWPHIYQSEGWKDKIPSLYNVMGIPQSYIIDRNGVIVAKNLRGEKLEEKIAEVVNK